MPFAEGARDEESDILRRLNGGSGGTSRAGDFRCLGGFCGDGSMLTDVQCDSEEDATGLRWSR